MLLLLLFSFQKQWNLLDKYVALVSSGIRIFCLKREKNPPLKNCFLVVFARPHVSLSVAEPTFNDRDQSLLINEGVSHQALLCNLRGLACGPPVTRFSLHFSRPAGGKENLSRILK